MNNQNLNPENSTFENLRDEHALDFWKHFAGIGGIDKDRMVTLSTWFLAFSATIIGYTLTNLDKSPSIILVIMGLLISLLACGIVILYGSYAMWNWAMADKIAEIKDWRFLLPDRPFPLDIPKNLKGFKKLQCSMIMNLGKPPSPRIRYAIIFKLFFLVSLISASINIALLVYIVKVN